MVIRSRPISLAQGLSKSIRILTVAPLMALALLTALFLGTQGVFRGPGDYLLSLLFLVALPVMAYPLQAAIPSLRSGGRETQRNLAMLLAVLGYLLGLFYALLSGTGAALTYIFGVYLLSVLLLLLFNKGLGIRASGHACGVAGPVVVLAAFLGWWALPGIFVLALVFWASLRMERHSLSELFIGSAVPLAASALLALLLL